MSSELLNKFFDYFLPRICPACNQKLKSFEEVVCDSCFSKLKLTSEALIKTEYEKKFASKNFVSDFHPVFIFESGNEIQHIIHACKYNRQYNRPM